MSEPLNCRQCGAGLGSDSHAGLCPLCLVQVGIALQPVANFKEQSPRAADSAEGLPRRFGDYELLERIARGGMGVVYRARQLSLKRIVALKMILSGDLATRQMILRFRAEAEAAANLHHPNIVAIYETGEVGGQHYFSMEHVGGADLGRIVAGGPLPARPAARYLEKVAQAVEYAHRQGVLHRDLKPSNVLIDENDEPRVTDFGLVKKFSADSNLTVSGQLLGSPNFMPPEQASAKRGKVGRHSDVYGLGALLYDLLTGRPPFQAATLEETLQQVFEQEPVSPRALDPSVPRDLETICLKCLEKEPARRYPTAQAVAEELRRFLCGEPIHARRVSAPERLWRWCRRNPSLAALGASVNVLLIALAVGSVTVANRERVAAERFRGLAETKRVLLYASELKAAQQAIEEGNMSNAVSFLNRHVPAIGQKEEDLREFTWRYLNHLCRPYLTAPALERSIDIFYLATPRDGRWLAAGGGSDLVTIWDLDSHALLREFHTVDALITGPLAFSPNGRFFLAAGLNSEWSQRGAQVWDTTAWTVQSLGFAGAYGDFSPDGSLLAIPTDSEVALLRVGGNWEELLRLTGHSDRVWSARFSPDGRRLVTASDDSTAQLWDVGTGQGLGIFTNHADKVWAAAFSPDGQWVVSAGDDQTVRLWDAATQRELDRYAHNVGLGALDFQPDGWRVASGGRDGSVKVWNPKSGALRTLRGHSQTIMAVKFIPGRNMLASASWDHTVKLWDLKEQPPNDVLESVFGALNAPLAFAPDPDNRLLATISSDALEIVLWDPSTGLAAGPEAGALTRRLGGITDLRALLTPKETASTQALVITNVVLTELAFSPRDGTLLAARRFDVRSEHSQETRQRLEFWNVRQGTMTRALSGKAPFVFSPDGRFLACRSAQAGAIRNAARIQIQDLASGKTWETEHEISTMEMDRLAFSPNGEMLVTSGVTSFVWESASGKRLATLASSEAPETQAPINVLAFTPDGQLLIAAGAAADIRVWEVATRRWIHDLRGHVPRVRSLAVSPDGRTLASGDANGLIKLWGLRRNDASPAAPWDIRELLTLHGHERSIERLQFSPDGNILASGSLDGTVRLWRAGRGQ